MGTQGKGKDNCCPGIQYVFFVTACRPAAELASFWNKPLITWVATDSQFNDKTVYTTLGRTLGPFNKMGIFLLEIFAQYNWRKVVVISSNFFIWLDAGKNIRKVSARYLISFSEARCGMVFVGKANV